MTNMVEFHNVSKRFGRTVALDDVTFQVPRGAVFGLLGENGAGKTTAIRLMLGLGNVDAGEITVMGHRTVREGMAIRRNVGYVAERPVFYEWMTAAQAGWFTSGFYPDGFQTRFGQLSQRFHVRPNQRVREMSKGTRARLALALALAPDPPLLLLDEPTSGLDTIVRHDFLESMVDLAAEGRTVFLSSHQIHEVERVADMIAILREGRLLVCEPLEQLKSTTTVITITGREASAIPPTVPGEVLAQRASGYQWHILARHVPTEAIDQLQQDERLIAVDTRRPSLEEIFVAYMRQKRSDAPATHAQRDSAIAGAPA